MTWLKSLAIRSAHSVGATRLLKHAPPVGLTTVLFHKFLCADESLSEARDRLKQQCEWIAAHYTPVDLKQVTAAVEGTWKLPQNPLLVTIDDALLQILDFMDIFRSFEIPVAVFVCAGWTSAASGADTQTKMACAISALEWYFGGVKTISGIDLEISREHRSEIIDLIIENESKYEPYFEEIISLTSSGGPRDCCNWQELVDLQSYGIDIGCHSVSHVLLGRASSTRISFEIAESKRVLEQKLGPCLAFAYPFGSSESASAATAIALRREGFRIGFLTTPAFTGIGSDRFELPRIALPDPPLSLPDFAARVSGGGAAIYALLRQLQRSR